MKSQTLEKARTYLEKSPQGTFTLLTVSLIGLTYLFLSYNYLYIPNEKLLSYGFELSNPLGAITYSFLHLSPQHIIANVALLLAVGIIAEKKLNFKDYFTIFFTSAITAGVAFQLLTPTPTVLVGASSAVSGILAVAVFVDFKKTIPAILIFGLFLSIVSPAVTTYTEKQLGLLENETTELGKQYNKTKEKIEESQQQLENLTIMISRLKEECLIKENETACVKWKELNKTLKEKEEKEEELQEKENETVKDLNKTMTDQMKLEQGIKREERAKTSAIVHLIGAFTGIGYLCIFRRDILWSLPSQASQLENYFQK